AWSPDGFRACERNRSRWSIFTPLILSLSKDEPFVRGSTRLPGRRRSSFDKLRMSGVREVLMPNHIADEIARHVASWPGVTVAPHRFGGVEFRVGRRELGHLHGGR